MNIRAIIHVIALPLGIMACTMLASALVSCIMGDSTHTCLQLVFCGAVTLACAAVAFCTTFRKPGEIRFKTGSKEGFASVGIVWGLCTFAAAVPFTVCADLCWEDAIFEAASGLTTTGASILSSGLQLNTGLTLKDGIEDLPYGLLFWRSILNWLGGVGIVFFVLLVLPRLKVSGARQFYNAEVPGLKADDPVTPRLVSSVNMVLFFYLGLTAFAIIIYCCGGMTLFDAINHAFTTVSTGGFSTKNNSIAYYRNPVLQWSIIALMFISSCNFMLMIKLLTQRTFGYFKDEECRCFTLTAFGTTLFVAATLYIKHIDGIPRILADSPFYDHGIETYLRTAAFQVVSVMSTTGFVTSDWNYWASPAIIMVFFILMFPCGCEGSTAGGMKYSRVILLFKQLRHEIARCFFPKTVQDIRLNGKRVPRELIEKTLAFIIIYIIVFVTVALLLTLTPDVGTKEAFSGALTCLSNVGPGYGKLGPSGAFDWLSAPAKYLLSFTMIAGRLELFTILLLFSPSFWKR